MNFKHNPSHPVHCFCRECTGHYAAYMAHRRELEGKPVSSIKPDPKRAEEAARALLAVIGRKDKP